MNQRIHFKAQHFFEISVARKFKTFTNPWCQLASFSQWKRISVLPSMFLVKELALKKVNILFNIYIVTDLTAVW